MKTIATMQSLALRLSSSFGILIASLVLIGQSQSLMAQTINIGPNQYAFQFTGNPNFGLFFNSTNTQYEFRNGSALPVFAINANSGQITSNLQMSSGSDYVVPNNRYAFRSLSNPNFGLFFNSSDVRYEFRGSTATPIFRIDASSGALISDGSITASGGNSTQWNQAHAWGNHAAAGYISSETDPKIASMATSQIPHWSGSQLVGSTISADAASVNINSTAAVPLLSLNSSNANANPLLSFKRNGAQTAYLQTFGSDLFLANQLSGNLLMSTNNIVRFAINNNGRVGINATPVASSALTVNTELTGRAIEATVSYSGSSDVVGVQATSVTNPGFGIGMSATGGFIGMRASGTGTSYTGTSYGLFATSTGSSAGTRTAVYGSASGGNTNWAGYFVQDTYIGGDLRIGTLAGASGYKLSVNGRIMCTELRVMATASWPDYVFGEGYELMPLNDLEAYVNTEKHLPGIPAAAEIENGQGFEVGEMQRITVEKLEELTLYLFELKRENEALKSRIELLENK